MAEPKDVVLKPYKTNAGEYLVTDIKAEYRRGSDGSISGGGPMTDTAYHEHRNEIMRLRREEPATAKLYDKYLSEVVEGKKNGIKMKLII